MAHPYDGQPPTSLEHRTKLVAASGVWQLALYEAAAEAVGVFRSAGSARGGRVSEPDTYVDPARRARGQVRRYCAANRLNRLGTLTYRGEGQFDPRQLRSDVGRFFRRLRKRVDATFPYLWTAEWHKEGHGLHVHFAVNRFVPREWLTAAWPHGFVHIKLIGDLPIGAGTLGEARAAARYLAKYVGKDLGRNPAGLHRYEVAQGFQPARITYRGRSADQVLRKAALHIGRAPSLVWRSAENPDWRAPSAVWAQWA